MKLLNTILTLAALALLAAGTEIHVGCTAPVNPDGTPSTQPAITVDSLVALAIADYDALVESGVVKETPELDQAITVYFQVQKDIAAGKPPVIAINDAVLNLAVAIHNARTAKAAGPSEIAPPTVMPAWFQELPRA